MKIEEDDIISLIQEGKDQLVIKHLYKTIFPKVKNTIRGRGGNVEDAADVFQEVIMSFYKLVVTNKFNEKYKVYGFLFTMSMNKWFNVLRKNKKLDLVEDFGSEFQLSYDDEDHEVKSSTDERTNLLSEFFSDLGARCLEILNYAIFQSISNEDIALRMDINNANSAKMQVFRCKQKLLQKVNTDASLKAKLQELI